MKSLLAAIAVLLSLATTASAQTVDDGWNAYDVGDYEKAKSIFLSLAEAGNAKAINAVGLMYSEGKAYPKDRKTACDWYEKSAELGYKSAQYNFAVCYLYEQGREKDFKLGLKWCEKAAKQGHRYCQIRLMHHYRNSDPIKAKYWGKMAADAGSKVARAALWSYYPNEFSEPPFLDAACISAAPYASFNPLKYCD